MSTAIIIKLPKQKKRNPLIATGSGKTQYMRDKRERRSNNANKNWKNEEY